MTELVGCVSLYGDEQDPSLVENVGQVYLYRELLGTVSLFAPFREFVPPTDPVAPDGKLKHDRIVVTQENITAKQFQLTRTSSNPDTVIFLPAGGIPQFKGEDFELEGNLISWNGLGLDGFIEKDDVIHVYYN